MRPEAIPTSQSAAPHAAQQKSSACLEVAVMIAVVLEIEATGQAHGRCFPRNAPRVAKTLKYLLNPVVIGQSTVQIVTAKRTQ